MDLNCLNGIRAATYDECAARVEMLRERAATARAIAEGELHAYQRAAIELAKKILERRGIYPGSKLKVLPAWSDSYRFGAEYSHCEFNTTTGELQILGWKLLKDGSRSKAGGPYILGNVSDQHANVALDRKPNTEAMQP